MNVMEFWPILAFMAIQTVTVSWWAATITQRILQLEEKAKTHAAHGESIVRFEAAIEHLTKRIEELLSEVRSKPRR